ncbi:MAG: hypothetical protein OXE99_15075 [Cellvibrionales bacterium]|nr:hypothetical protein [Cellvibrionales bacterium]
MNTHEHESSEITTELAAQPHARTIIGVVSVFVYGSYQAFNSYLSYRLAENALARGQQLESLESDGSKLIIKFRVMSGAQIQAANKEFDNAVEISREIIELSLKETQKKGEADKFKLEKYTIDSVKPENKYFFHGFMHPQLGKHIV